MLHTVPAALTAGTAPPVYKIRIYYIELCRKFKQKQTSFPKKFYTSFTQGFPLSIHRLSTARSAPLLCKLQYLNCPGRRLAASPSGGASKRRQKKACRSIRCDSRKKVVSPQWGRIHGMLSGKCGRNMSIRYITLFFQAGYRQTHPEGNAGRLIFRATAPSVNCHDLPGDVQAESAP